MKDELWEEFKQTLVDYPDGVINMFHAKDKELTALRDWKAKAMPFLYYAYAKIEKEDTISGTFPNDDITKTLTELLGGEDERND